MRVYMKSFVYELKRKIRYETSCLNLALVFTVAAFCAVACIITAVSNFDGEAYELISVPKVAMPPFFVIFFWTVETALFGAAVGITVSIPSGTMEMKRKASALMFCVLAASYAWIPLFYAAQCFFISALCAVCALILSAAVFSICRRISKMAGLLVMIYTVWLVYIVLLSFSFVFVA